MKNQTFSPDDSGRQTPGKNSLNMKSRNDVEKVVKCPVENDESSVISESKRLSPGVSGETHSLSSDVEEDGEPVVLEMKPVAVACNVQKGRSDQALTGLLDKLTISEEETTDKGQSLSKPENIKTEMVDDEDVSCDKAAKDLSNLLKVLNLQEESKREESGDEAQSILRDIDESLAKLKLNCPKPIKQSLKSRGFGDEDCSGAYVWAESRELDLQPAADLADFFSRQYSDMFMTQSPNMLQTSLNFDSRTNSSWGQANTPHDLTNSNYQNEIFGGVNSDRLSDIVSGPPSQNYQFTVDRDGASSRTMMVNIPNSKDLGFTFTNLGYSYEIPVQDSSETVKAKRIKYSEWNQRGNVFGSPTSDTSVTLPSECARTQDSVPQRAADQLYTTANLDQTTCASIYAPAASSHVYRNVTSRSSASSSAMSTGIPSPSSAYSSDMTASSPGSVFSPQSQRSNSPPDVGHIYCPPSWSDSGISSSQYSPYSSQQSSDSPGSPSSQAVTDFSAESSVNSQQSRQSLYTSVGTRDQDFISGRPMRPANSDRPEQTFLGRLPIPARTLPSVGQQPRVDSPYERSFHFKNEEGDGLLHILVYMYECQLMSANPETAPKFLQYISRRFLSHPSIATCLNHQNNQLQTPLYLAVKKSLTGMVDLLMKYGADVNIQGRWQAEWEKIPQLDAPLHAAVAMGDRGLNLVNTLLTSNAADINILNTEGETPLHVASREHGTPDLNNNSKGVKSCMKMVQLLLQRDADMMAKDYKSGKTPIMLAIEGRDVGLVRMMLDISGPRICHSLLNECTHGLNTCMHLAFGLKHMEPSKHVELIRLLVRSGGEAETENSANHKAKDMAPHIYTKAVEIWR